MTPKLNRAGWAAALAAALVASSLAAASPSAAQAFGYEIKCKTTWQVTPNGGYMPDRPGYQIKSRKCVGVPKRPSYLDEPRNPVRIRGRLKSR